MPDTTLEERFNTLEQQHYLMYLQLNAITDLLIRDGFLLKEQVGATMDTFHQEVEDGICEGTSDH